MKGLKTYIVVIVGIIANGAFAMGYIPDGIIPVVNAILVYLGIAALRAGVSGR